MDQNTALIVLTRATRLILNAAYLIAAMGLLTAAVALLGNFMAFLLTIPVAVGLDKLTSSGAIDCAATATAKGLCGLASWLRSKKPTK